MSILIKRMVQIQQDKRVKMLQKPLLQNSMAGRNGGDRRKVFHITDSGMVVYDNVWQLNEEEVEDDDDGEYNLIR